MELQEFLEKFLPDYQKRISEIKAKNKSGIVLPEGKIVQSNATKWFTEALQNFVDKICKAQKQLCSYHATYTHCGRCEHNKELYDAIKNAEQPKIEEL